jgi:Sec-independent protein secretion pathway component TatC
MVNRKTAWLIVRVLLIALFITSVLLSPSKDTFQLVMRTVMIIILGTSFIMDLHEYRKDKKAKNNEDK